MYFDEILEEIPMLIKYNERGEEWKHLLENLESCKKDDPETYEEIKKEWESKQFGCISQFVAYVEQEIF